MLTDFHAFQAAARRSALSHTHKPRFGALHGVRYLYTASCTHPPRRLYTWTAYDGALCIACTLCGAVLRGAA